MNPEKSSTTRNQKNQTHEPRKIINNLKPEKSNFTFSQSNPLISQQTHAHKVTKPTTTIVDQKREKNDNFTINFLHWMIRGGSNPWQKPETHRNSHGQKAISNLMSRHPSSSEDLHFGSHRCETHCISLNSHSFFFFILPILATKPTDSFSHQTHYHWSPLLILLGWSSSLFFFFAMVWDIFQPTQSESKSS